MTEEQIMAGAVWLAENLLRWGKWPSLSGNEKASCLNWAREVVAAMEAAPQASAPVTEPDRMWRHLVDVSSS